MSSNNKNKKGFSLIELLVYVGVFSIAAGLTVGILTTVMKISKRETSSVEVNSQLNFVNQTISRLVRESSAIIVNDDGNSSNDGVSGDGSVGAPYPYLVLRIYDSGGNPLSDRDPIVVWNDGGIIRMREGIGAGQRTTDLTSDRITVDNLRFAKIVNYPAHDAVSVDIQLTYNSPNLDSQTVKTSKFSISRVSAATFDSNLLPGADNYYDIGFSGSGWRDANISRNLFVGGSIGIGTASPGSYKLNIAGGDAVINGIKVGLGGGQIFNNTIIGNTSFNNNTTGVNNSALGYQALYSNTIGALNSALGYQALYSNTVGARNSALGYQALFYNTTGVNNSAFGYTALYSNTTGYNNLAFGDNALSSNTTGYYNIAIGSYAGMNLTTGNRNIVIGYNVYAPAATANNTLNIGNLIYANGLDGTGSTLSSGNVGIGTASPIYKLDVNGQIRATEGTLIYQCPSGDPDYARNMCVGQLSTNSICLFAGGGCPTGCDVSCNLVGRMVAP